ncbi:hypothetical protein OPQ81_003105 [Rhizoctonia solani]|nr:hypothetical protein OPQ81_003105 [Rhizoctonia solani]
MPGRHPCERGQQCSCHLAGPSSVAYPTKKTKTTLLTAAALVCPVLGAPTPPLPTHLPFLYPALNKRVTDAGQAPDDPSEGFQHQHIQLADLIRAGLPYKYVYDPSATIEEIKEGADTQMKESDGAWVIDNLWTLHGRRFGPLYATATADITDDPLPTPTESVPPASTPTATSTSTSPPTVLAIQSSLPTGWDSSQYQRSEMYAIPLVVSFALVIALIIGSLIGALVIRRDRSRSRRRKKRIIQGDDDSAREKVAQSSLVSRLGRALRHHDQPEQEEHDATRTELEQRIKSWARRSAAWRVQARIGVRRRIGRGRKRESYFGLRLLIIHDVSLLPTCATLTQLFSLSLIIGSQADSGPGPISGAIQEEPEAEEREGRNSTRAPTPAQSRAPTPIATNPQPPEPPTLNVPAPNYPSPTVPTYSSPSSAAGPSTPLARTQRTDPLTRIEAHPDATPSDEPAYDGPGSGEGLPPAYRGAGLSEVARGKRPAQASSESLDEAPTEERREERRVWTELDAYAFGQGQGGEAVTAHVATDDKRVLERLHSMRGAPEDERTEEEQVRAPREEDVFGSGTSSPNASTPVTSHPSSGSGLLSSLGPEVLTPRGSEVLLPSGNGTGVLPLPPTKIGIGPVARYGEADLCLPRYLDGQAAGGGMLGGMAGQERDSVPGKGNLVPGEEGLVPGLDGLVPSAPPCEEETVLPSAPVLEDEAEPVACAPLLNGLVPSVPPWDDRPCTSPVDDRALPSAPPLDDDPSASLQDHDGLHPGDKTFLDPSDSQTLSGPRLQRTNSSCPLLSEEQ